MNREQKAAAVSELGEGLAHATNAFVLEFKGITVPQVTELRKQVRDTNSKYVVVKNTLALIAVKDSPLTQLKEYFKGPTAVAYNTTDGVILAKALTKFAKDVPAVQFKGALLAGAGGSAGQNPPGSPPPFGAAVSARVRYPLSATPRGTCPGLA